MENKIEKAVDLFKELIAEEEVRKKVIECIVSQLQTDEDLQKMFVTAVQELFASAHIQRVLAETDPGETPRF